jgi:hypothetical protein
MPDRIVPDDMSTPASATLPVHDMPERWTSPSSRLNGRRMAGVGAGLAVAVLVAAFALVAIATHHWPAITPTSSYSASSLHPAASCPAPPATYTSGPILYWAQAAAARKAGAFGSGVLCALGFQPSERVTLTVSPAVVGNASDVSSMVLGTAVADTHGAFVFGYSLMDTACSGGVGSRVITASGDRGSSASATLPPGLERGIACRVP